MSDPNNDLWEQIQAVNDTMHSDGTSDNAAVERLSELLAEAAVTDYSSTGDISEYDGSVTLSTLSRSDTTVVMAATFTPGGQIHPHDHEGFVGAMRVLSGSFEFSTFEIVDGLRRPEHDPMQLRPTGSTTLTAGDISTITADDGHVHTVVAGPDGGSFVDAYLMRTNPGSCRFFQPTGEPNADGTIDVEGVLDAPIH